MHLSCGENEALTIPAAGPPDGCASDCRYKQDYNWLVQRFGRVTRWTWPQRGLT